MSYFIVLISPVLFWEVFQPERYAATLFQCALEQDLLQLPAGDATEIGEQGGL